MDIQLKAGYSLAIEPHLKTRVRIIINQHGSEVACRKESIKTLLHFMQTEGRIFKGRIRLDKHNNNISIELKGEVIGNIPAEELFHLLQQQPNFTKALIQ